MKEKLKKGFTIVELVIVIAVIAILAAVLIPTFSSITNNAKESAALQQATNGMKSILSLTTGTMPENTKFYVSEDGEETKYVFKYEGNKIQGDASENQLAFATKDSEYWIYISPKAIASYDETKGTVATGNTTLTKNLAARIAKAIGGTAETGDKEITVNAGFDYVSATIGGKAVRLYWSSDLEPTLFICLGNGKVSMGETETVNVSVTGATLTSGATIAKDHSTDVTLTISAAGDYTVTINGTPAATINGSAVTEGKITTTQANEKVTVTLTVEQTAADVTIVVEEVVAP